jgi:hypothetical protein
MATEKEPKQTNQSGEGRKDGAKPSQPGHKIDDQSNLANASTDSSDQEKGNGGKAGQGGQNSQGGQWGLNKGKGGQDSHNKR